MHGTSTVLQPGISKWQLHSLDTRPSEVTPTHATACHLMRRIVTPDIRRRCAAPEPPLWLAEPATACAAGTGICWVPKTAPPGAAASWPARAAAAAAGDPGAGAALLAAACRGQPRRPTPPTAAPSASSGCGAGSGAAGAAGAARLPGWRATGRACCPPKAAVSAAMRCVSRVAASWRRRPAAASPSSSCFRSRRLGHAFSWDSSASSCSRLHGQERTTEGLQWKLDASKLSVATCKAPQ